MRAAKVAALGLATAALVSACAHGPTPKQVARAQEVLPTEQFKATVEEHPEQIALGLHPSGLSANQQAAMAQFVSRWRNDGGGAVVLRAPLGGDARLSRHMEDDAGALLVKLGVPRERLDLQGYIPDPKTAVAAPLLISYQRYEAVGPNCSGGWKDVTSTGANIPYDHFGCAVTANFAAMVANPRDLLAPAVETPADNSRRQVVLGKYRNGEITSSVKDSQADGKVSDAAGGGG